MTDELKIQIENAIILSEVECYRPYKQRGQELQLQEKRVRNHWLQLYIYKQIKDLFWKLQKNL